MWCSRALGHFIVCLRCLTLTLFVVAGGTFGGHCLPSEVDFDRYLSWPDMVCFFMLFFRSRLWSLFVVFQSNWVLYCLPSMLDFDASSRGWTSSASSCFPSEVDFECYLSWPDMVCFLMFFFRNRLWSLFVVFQSILKSTVILLFAFDAWFWRYLSGPDALLKLLGHFGVNQRWLK